MLILLRHGRTAHNAGHRLLGRLDVDLDDLGVRQAEAMAGAPELAEVTRVVSSPLRRCRRTAEVLGRPVCVDDRWVEVDYGDYDGLELDAVPASLWEAWHRDLSWAPPGGESLSAVARRVADACDELWEEAATTDVAVVTHVSPIKAAIGWALGAPDEAVWRMFVDVASMHRIGQGRWGPSLRSFNEVHHRPSA